MNKLVSADYDGLIVSFTEDGWFNATQAAAKFGKVPAEWLRLPSTIEYVAALKRHNESMGKTHKSKSGPASGGGGTWLHPKLAVPFARWLDADFAVWCDAKIDGLIRGKDDWRKLRHTAASSYKAMAQVLQFARERLGKTCAPHHFSNEARLINFALTGEFCKVNRETLSAGDLDLLAKLETLDTVLLGCGSDYEVRKAELERYAADQRQLHLTAANGPVKIGA